MFIQLITFGFNKDIATVRHFRLVCLTLCAHVFIIGKNEFKSLIDNYQTLFLIELLFYLIYELKSRQDQHTLK